MPVLGCGSNLLFFCKKAQKLLNFVFAHIFRMCFAAILTEDNPFYADPEVTSPPVPFYHYCAGTFKNDRLSRPTGLQFTNSEYMLEVNAIGYFVPVP